MSRSPVANLLKSAKQYIAQNMKKKTKIGIGIAAALIVIFLLLKPGGNSNTSNADSPSTISLVSASSYQTIEGYVSAVGEVESVDQVTLSSEVSGSVQHIYAEIGDYVNAGDALVKLESGTYDAQLAQASATIDKAQAALDQVIAGATSEEIAQSSASVAQAEASLTASEVAYEQAELSAQQSIDDASASLETAENNLRLSEEDDTSDLVNDEYADLVNTIKSAYTVVVNTMEDTDEVLGLDNKSVNDSFEDLISASDSQALTDAENTFNSLELSLDLQLSTVNSLNDESDHDLIEEYAGKADSILEEVEEHLYAMIDVMNATPNSVDLTATQINTYVSTFTTDLTNAQTKMGNLTDGMQAISTAELGYDNALITYEAEQVDYDQAQTSAEQTIAAAAASLDVQKAALAAAQAAYNLLTADPRDVDLASYEASVAEAYASYQLAAVNQGKTLVTAPISGQVSVMSLQEGDLVSVAQSVVSLVNVDQLQVTAYISADDLKWMRLGDPVLVNESIDAEVYRVSPSINPTTKKIEIQVLITGVDADVTVGEYVQIEVLSSQVEDENVQYFLPLAAIKVSSSKSYVYVVTEQGLLDQHEVELGEVAGETVEILSGLTPELQFASSVRGLSVGDSVNVLNSEE
jgi:RND family efflux transporter MFP subunit